MTKSKRIAAGVFTIITAAFSFYTFIFPVVPHLTNVSNFVPDLDYFLSGLSVVSWGCTGLAIFGGFLLCFDKGIGGILALFGSSFALIERVILEYPQFILPFLGQPIPLLISVLFVLIGIGVLAICIICTIVGIRTGSES